VKVLRQHVLGGATLDILVR